MYTFRPEVWAEVQGRAPILLHLLEGYVDAGGVTRNLAEHILAQCEHQVVVEFDVDQLHDYRSRRPAMTFDEGRWGDVVMPALTLHRVTDADGVDFLLLDGPEPDHQWGRALDAILTVLTQLGVQQLITGTGMPMAVPHTRPVLVTEHTTVADREMANPAGIDRVTVPGSFAALLEVRAAERGIHGGGFFAHVPHYLSQGSFTPATLQVLERINQATGLTIPTEQLAETVSVTLNALAMEVDQDGELGTMITTLEEQYDEAKVKDESAVPSVDEIGVALEQFFAEHNDGSKDS